MKNDLTSVFESVRTKPQTWSPSILREVLKMLSDKVPTSQAEWDEGDEEWGRVLSSSDLVAIVSARFPLAFVRSDFRALAEKCWQDFGVTVISIPDFDAQSYSVSKSVLEAIFGCKLSSRIDYDCLSINDLWWATVIA